MSDDHIRLVEDDTNTLIEQVYHELGVTLTPGDSNEDVRNLEHQVVATMSLSGTIVKVAVSKDSDEPTIWLWTDDASEVTYMSPCEGRLLIAALQLAVHESTGKDA